MHLKSGTRHSGLTILLLIAAWLIGCQTPMNMSQDREPGIVVYSVDWVDEETLIIQGSQLNSHYAAVQEELIKKIDRLTGDRKVAVEITNRETRKISAESQEYQMYGPGGALLNDMTNLYEFSDIPVKVVTAKVTLISGEPFSRRVFDKTYRSNVGKPR